MVEQRGESKTVETKTPLYEQFLLRVSGTTRDLAPRTRLQITLCPVVAGVQFHIFLLSRDITPSATFSEFEARPETVCVEY